jgi:hypothetical protein
MSQNSVKVGSSDTIFVEMVVFEELLQAESYWRIDHHDVMVTGSEEFYGLEATCVEVLEEFDIDEIVTVERITSLHDFEGRVDTFSLSDWKSKGVEYTRISVTRNDSVVWEHVLVIFAGFIIRFNIPISLEHRRELIRGCVRTSNPEHGVGGW